MVSINLHITNACNYKCKFCFAHFENSKNLLRLPDWKIIIDDLKEHGARKINFVGGEPLLHPDIAEMIRYTSELGIVTTIVTNGSLLTRSIIEKIGSNVDWVGFSIDSFDESTERELGRKYKVVKEHNHIGHILEIVPLLRAKGVKIKINTVITKLTWQEDMIRSIGEIGPERWKVFQVLPIEGENDQYFEKLKITKEEFKRFTEKHSELGPIVENNEDMTGSYVMIDPQGRFFDNETGTLRYSRSILDIGVEEAFNEITFSMDKMIERKGIYDWI